MKTLIEVTENHIAKGRRRRCDACPVALAVKEKSESFYSVGSDGITFIDTDKDKVKLKEFDIPYEVRTFIINYDDDKTVYPFSFYLDIPEEYLKP